MIQKTDAEGHDARQRHLLHLSPEGEVGTRSVPGEGGPTYGKSLASSPQPSPRRGEGARQVRGNHDENFREDFMANKHTGPSRRSVIATGLGALAAPAVLRVIPAEAQSRVIKIGHVSPRTGPLAGFGEADPYVLAEIQKVLDKGITSGGKTYKVHIIS